MVIHTVYVQSRLYFEKKYFIHLTYMYMYNVIVNLQPTKIGTSIWFSHISEMAKATTKWNFLKEFNGKNCTQIGLQVKNYHFRCWSLLPLFNPFYLGNYKS